MRDDLKRRGGITYERVAKNRKMKDKKMPFATRLFDGRDYGSRILAKLSFSFLVAETPTTVSDRQNRPRRFPKRGDVEERMQIKRSAVPNSLPEGLCAK